MLAALSSALILQTTAPSVASESLESDRHRVTVTFSTAEANAAAEVLNAEAARLCRPRYSHYEQYQFEGQQAVTGPEAGRPGVVTLRQEIRCSDTPQEASRPPAAAVATTPSAPVVDTAALQPLIDTLTGRYFDALDAQDYAAAHALTSPLAGLTQAGFEEDQTQQRADVGARRGARGFRTTWYVDHPNAPPGVFAAVDFGARHERGRVCGSVGWFRPEGETDFRITTLNTTIISEGLDPQARAHAEAIGRCVDPPPETAA